MKKIIIVGAAIVVLIALSLLFLLNPSEVQLFPHCPFHTVTGLYCPGCGSQRAAHDILNGDLLAGLQHNALIILVGAVLLIEGVILLLQSVFSMKIYNPLHNTWFVRLILVVVILFWILRNLPYEPFAYLAP